MYCLGAALAYHISKPLEQKKVVIKEQDKQFIRMLARRTWHILRSLLRQQAPSAAGQFPETRLMALRIDIPNQYRASFDFTLSAYDFGFITRVRLIELFERIFASIDKLENEGAFIQLVHIKHLMRPRYISILTAVIL